ncbi:hypothetical protein JCM5353_001975 [Sporobolomyces roseus]
MERLEKGKGKEGSIKKREVKKQWKKRNRNHSAEQESISQDGNLSENGAALANAINCRREISRSSLSTKLDPLSRWQPPSSSSSSSSSSDLDFAPDADGLHPNHLPPSITHAIHSEVRRIYEYPKKKATSFMLDPRQGFVEVEVEIEEGGQKYMHWLEQENQGEEEQVEQQRNLEDEIDEEENDDCLSKEDRQEKMGSSIDRIGDKREGEEGEMVEAGVKTEELEAILEENVTTTIQGVVEMEEDEEDEEGDSEKRQELEDQLRQTLASSNLLDHIGDNYRCDCYNDDDHEKMKGITGGDQYGMGIEGGLNSNSEEEERDDSDSLSHSISLQQSQPPAPQPATKEHPTISKGESSNKLKNLKKKEQKKRKKEEKKQAKLAGELERVEGQKRKAVDEVVSTTDGGSEKKKRKGNRKSEKGKGSNA